MSHDVSDDPLQKKTDREEQRTEEMPSRSGPDHTRLYASTDEDPAFLDTSMAQGLADEPQVAPEDEEIAHRTAQPQASPAKLALVIFVLFPALGYLFYYQILPAQGIRPPLLAKAAGYPDAPFRTTTDKPMSAGEIDAWLEAKPTSPPAKPFAALSPGARIGAGSRLASDAPYDLPPGYLFNPESGQMVQVDEPAAKKPSRRKSAHRSGQPKASARPAGASGSSAAGGQNALGLPLSLDRLAKSDPAFIYQAGTVKNSNVFQQEEAPSPDEPAEALPLDVGDAFSVKLHSGLSSVSSDNVVLVKVTRPVRKGSELVIPKGTIIRGSIRTFGERRFFLNFGELTVSDVRYRFQGRAEERNYAGIVAVRREATLKERQRATVVDGVLSGLVGASAIATQSLPVGVQQASQVIASGTRNNALRDQQVREGFVLEAAKGKRFRILVTR